MKRQELKTIPKDQITQVYSGRPGCACGCRGNYTESQMSKTRMLNKFLALPAEYEIMASDGLEENEKWVAWENVEGTRTYTIYWKEEK